MYSFGTNGGLFELCATDNLEIFSVIIAAACHDYKHPGLNNSYLIENKDPISILYNGRLPHSHLSLDVAVLENYHVA